MLDKIESKILEIVEEINYDEATRLFKKLNGGKRLRARLIATIAQMSDDAIKLGSIVELIHASSLLHDDVIDEAVTRRGVESVNASDGSKTAIMLGDILYSKAYTSLVDFDPFIAKSVASAVTRLSVGETMDVKLGEKFNDNEDVYLKMLDLKTAALIESSSECAAHLMGYDTKLYALYGKNLGISFQIIDDILDITQDEKTLGKPALNDFVEGKCTLPYIYLYKELDEVGKAKLKSYHKKVLNDDEKHWIKTNMKKFNSVEKSYDLAKKLSDEAAKAIEGDVALEMILAKMLERNF